MDSSNWSRWYVKNVEENLFFAEGQEYQLFVTKTNGRDIRSEIESIEKEGLEGQTIFGESSYENSQNKEQPMYTFGKFVKTY